MAINGSRKKTGFYRPHERVGIDVNFIVDDFTGELKACPSMTKQAFVAQCDINNILRQYKTTGMIAHVRSNAEIGRYEDLPDEVDFQESLNLVKSAQEAFDSLPSKLRNRFANDPAQFLAFCSDPANLEEMGELGLLKPKPPAAAPPASGPEAGQVAPAPEPTSDR